MKQIKAGNADVIFYELTMKDGSNFIKSKIVNNLKKVKNINIILNSRFPKIIYDF